MEEKIKKRLCGTEVGFSSADWLLLYGQNTAKQIEEDWKAYCQETGTSIDDLDARALWEAYDPSEVPGPKS